MKIVVIGGTGLIGSKLILKLSRAGHGAVPASPGSGVNTLTGEGLAEVLEGAQVVVDVSNSPSFADDDVMAFFTTSTGNLLAAEKVAGVAHHVALSVVGADRLVEGGYMRAKAAQETLIRDSGIPFSIVHATQFYEFAKAIAQTATDGSRVTLPSGLTQPIAADDVASALFDTATSAPLNGSREIAGPEAVGLDEFVRRALAHAGDPRTVVTDPAAPYFGMVLQERSLLPQAGATIYPTNQAEWLDSDDGRSAR